NCYNLKIGESFCVRPGTAPACTKWYTAVSGDSCSAIESANGISASAFATLNPGLTCQNLLAGERVCVSSSTPSTTTATTTTTAKATGTSTPHSNKLIGYWGQNAASQSSGTQASLGSYCAKGVYDTINLAFMSSFSANGKPTYVLNFANLGGYDSTKPASSFGINAIATDIKQCQSLGVKILLSVGGSTNTYDVKNGDGVVLANQWHNAFFGGADKSEPRPFTDVILDGIDLDIEKSVVQQELVKLAQRLRSLNPGLIVTSAPQCFLGDANNSGSDANLGNFLKTTSAYDYIQVQFYNNPSCEIGAVGFEANFKKWVSLYGKNVVILLPGSSASAGNGFVQNTADVAAAAKKLRAAYTADIFNAIGLFDVSSAEGASGGVTVTAANLAYDYGIRAALDSF
ncbi:hypothetical protein HK101_004352, partial [Irineochytrium annulatum]